MVNSRSEPVDVDGIEMQPINTGVRRLSLDDDDADDKKRSHNDAFGAESSTSARPSKFRAASPSQDDNDDMSDLGRAIFSSIAWTVRGTSHTQRNTKVNTPLKSALSNSANNGTGDANRRKKRVNFNEQVERRFYQANDRTNDVAKTSSKMIRLDDKKDRKVWQREARARRPTILLGGSSGTSAFRFTTN